MALQIIVVGDSTSHGGKVITGSELHTIGGKKSLACMISSIARKSILTVARMG